MRYFAREVCFVLANVLRFACSHGGDHHEDHGKISDSQHYEASSHNVDFDHDAFLGRGHGHDYDSLTPDESRRRLRDIVQTKIDQSKDGFVDFAELRAWIEKQRTAYMWDTIDDVIRREDENHDGRISWDEYKALHFGRWTDSASLDKRLKTKIEKARRKFGIADSNKDGYLERSEYVYFRHPEESENMADIAVDEVLDDIDQNGDRLIDMDEFLGQYDEDDGEPPYWVIEDRKHFAETLDHDRSGVLEWSEVQDWVLPKKSDTDDETKHLIDGADDDGDGKLSFTEVERHYNLFVGSTATNHGKALRDEF